jgi:hypothetical protein
MRPIKPWLALYPLLLAGILSVQAADVQYRNRADPPRKEGILRGKPISNNRFGLLGVGVDAQVEHIDKPRYVSLIYWLPVQEDLRPSSGSLRAEVRKFSDYYLMEPAALTDVAGTNTFRWPTTPVLRSLGLHPSELTLIIFDSDTRVYFPGCLTYERAAFTQRGYRFDFFLQGSLQTAVTIVREREGMPLERIASFNARFRNRNIITIRWEGRTSDGQYAPAGFYRLQLRGRQQLYNRDISLAKEVRFWVDPEAQLM